MAKTEFRATIDGEGRVRFFVDGGAHTIDEYVAKYIKVHGVMPEIPVGLGGRAAPIANDPAEPTKEELLKAEVDELKTRLAALEAGSLIDKQEISQLAADEEDADVAE